MMKPHARRWQTFAAAGHLSGQTILLSLAAGLAAAGVCTGLYLL